jgi:hypothetical protein
MICSTRAGTAVIANPEATNSAAAKVLTHVIFPHVKRCSE